MNHFPNATCGAERLEHGMVVYYTKDGDISENPMTSGYKVFVGTCHTNEPFTLQSIHYRRHNQQHADSHLIHGLEKSLNKRKWLRFYLDAVVRKDRKVCKYRLPTLPEEMREVLKTEKDVIVVDIDGTLKVFDSCLATPPMEGATQYLNDMASCGKMIIYLTARGTTMAGITKDWLKKSGFPEGPLFVSERDIGYVTKAHQQRYKEIMLNYIQTYCNIIECYGDQDSDIAAYKTVFSNPSIFQVKCKKFWLTRCAESAIVAAQG